MKSKEEIIEQFGNDPFTGSINQGHAERCFEIASEYAKQEAIAFAEWIHLQVRIEKYNGRLKWQTEIKEDVLFESGKEWYDTEQLYNLYLESKKQKV